jgi:hypothetical protein
MPLLTSASYAFANCNFLTSVKLPSILPSITDMSYAFSELPRITNITLPATPKLTNASRLFSGSSKLTSITFPNSFPSLTTATYMFNELTELTSLELNSTLFPVLEYADYMFNGCSKLNTISIGNMPNIKTMSYMFYNCEKLENVSFPSSLTAYNMQNMFRYCAALKSVALPSNMPNVANLSFLFADTGLTTVPTFPQEMPDVSIMSYMFASTYITSIDISTLIPKITDLSNMFSNCELLESVNISSSINTVKTTASIVFWLFSNLASVVLPQETLPYLPRQVSMFYGVNKLTSIDLPPMPSVTSMTYMFYNCSSLNTIGNINLLGTSSPVLASSFFNNGYSITDISMNALLTKISFSNCTNLEHLRLNPLSSFSSTSAPQIDVTNSNMDASALNLLFGDLPSVSKTITITGSLGANTCDVSIAQLKGWTVNK